jgi:hypothetical protein
MPIKDDDLRRSAYRLSGAMITMLRADGLDPDILGNPDAMDADGFARSIEVDAELYMSMNPDKLTAEYDEIRHAATDTWRRSDPTGVVDSMRTEIEANWHGDAAQAFTTHLHKIGTFVDTQFEYTLLAAQAVGMMFAVNTQFRASCVDLMEKTALTCDSVAAGNGSSGATWAQTGVGLVSAVVDTVKNVNPANAVTWAIDQFLGKAADAIDNPEVEGAEAIPVVTGYTSARDRLFASYEDNLDQVRAWLAGRRAELASLGMTIPEPMPANADVDSPDFRYENFAHGTHATPADYTAEVERERRRYVDEQAKPDGVIGRRLAGR